MVCAVHERAGLLFKVDIFNWTTARDWREAFWRVLSRYHGSHAKILDVAVYPTAASQ